MFEVRTFIAYTSLFVALVQYIYILHFPVANQWSFKNVGRRFQISSVTLQVPTIRTWVFTSDGVWMNQSNVFEECVEQYDDSYIDFDSMKLDMAEWAWKYLPEKLVSALLFMTGMILFLVYMNATESFLYFKIDQAINKQ